MKKKIELKEQIENRKKSIRRINGRYILNEFGQLFNLERGYFFTIKELLFHPGNTISDFLFQDRSKYFKPLTFVILNTAILLLFFNVSGGVFNFFTIDIEFREVNNPSAFRSFITNYLNTSLLNEWINRNVGYVIIFFSLIISFWLKALFKRTKINNYEILVAFCYLSGEIIFLLVLTFLAISIYVGLWKLIKELFLSQLGEPIVKIGFIGWPLLLYLFWGLIDFFGKRKVLNYFKILFGYILSIITYVIFYLSSAIMVTYFNQ